MGIPNKTIDDIKKEGLDVTNYITNFSSDPGTSKYTLCIVFYFWNNRDFSIRKKDPNSRSILLYLIYHRINMVELRVNNQVKRLTIPSSFNGKKIVIWLTENFNSNITKVKISNYNSILSLPIVRYTNEQEFVFTTQGGV